MNKKYFRYILRHFIIWTIAFSFWTVMRQFGQKVVLDYPTLNFLQQLRIHLGLGVVAGVIFGNLEYLFDRKIYKHVSLGRAVLIGTFSYLLAIIVLVFFGMRIFARVLDQTLSPEVIQDFFFSKEMLLIILYSFIIGFFVDLFKQVDKKLGPGNLWKMLKGEFYHPKEDERIFMFLDLRGSTAIAEKIGHMQYSKLIQDCFQDLHVVEKYGAEVYQYVGDEVVLTWKKEIGLVNSNCLRAFFEYRDELKKKSNYYLKTYGVEPEFKAGLNMGEIVVAEVGEIKTEIAYHGDTINTAARIQEQCNVLGRSVLISERLQKKLNLDISFSSAYVGDVQLKGKSNKVNIYSVEVS